MAYSKTAMYLSMQLDDPRTQTKTIGELVELYKKHRSTKKVAAELGVHERSVFRWCVKFPALARAMRKGVGREPGKSPPPVVCGHACPICTRS
jgi:hypothetical protein